MKVEFDNMRPGVRLDDTRTKVNARVQSAKSALGNFTDEYDDHLYSEAQTMFWKKVKEYRVSRSFCLNLCPEARKYFGAHLQLSSSGDSVNASTALDLEYDWPGRYHLDEDHFDELDDSQNTISGVTPTVGGDPAVDGGE